MNIVHIGLPKTGSTTLQNTLFVEQQHFAYVGKSKSRNLYQDERLRELVFRIVVQDSLEYEPWRAVELVAQLWQGTKPILFSDETFSIRGGADRRLIAERLYHLFAPAKVLIVVRAQPTMLQSNYLNYLYGGRGSGQRLETFAKWLEANYSGIRQHHLTYVFRVALDYEPLVRTYEEFFGVENVIVLPFELMRDKNSLFPASLADLLQMALPAVQMTLNRNIDNQRMSRRHLFALHLQDSLLHGTNLSLLGRRLLPSPIYEPIRRFVTGGARKSGPDFPDGWLARVTEMCARGNAELEARKKIPLRTLGYPVEDRPKPEFSARQKPVDLPVI
jgi:hypothetical protein